MSKRASKNAFGEFLVAKRREKGMTSARITDAVGISAGYYCDIEKGRRRPPDKEILSRIVSALQLEGVEVDTFYDLAGKARDETPQDLPEYINENQIVRVALRLAKERGSSEDWRRFIQDLEHGLRWEDSNAHT